MTSRCSEPAAYMASEPDYLFCILKKAPDKKYIFIHMCIIGNLTKNTEFILKKKLFSQMRNSIY